MNEGRISRSLKENSSRQQEKQLTQEALQGATQDPGNWMDIDKKVMNYSRAQIWETEKKGTLLPGKPVSSVLDHHMASKFPEGKYKC